MASSALAPTSRGRCARRPRGARRAYKFKPSDSRVFEEQTLERQLKASAFLPTTKEDMDTYSLSEGERRGPPTFRKSRAE